jgi:hypothetical protein
MSATAFHSLIGKIAYASHSIPSGKAFLQRLWSALYAHGAPTSHTIKNSGEIQSDLGWWAFALKAPRPRKLWAEHQAGEYSLHVWTDAVNTKGSFKSVHTDASLKGLSINWDGQITVIPSKDRHRINWRELYTVVRACQLYGSSWAGRFIRLRVDNTTAVSYINKGYGKSPALSALAAKIKWLEATHSFEVRADYIHTTQQRADAPSRLTAEPTRGYITLSLLFVRTFLAISDPSAVISWGELTAVFRAEAEKHVGIFDLRERSDLFPWRKHNRILAVVPRQHVKSTMK